MAKEKGGWGLVKPPVLKVGDRVRVVAPSSNIGGLSPEAVKRGLSNLEGLGLQVELDEGCWRGWTTPWWQGWTLATQVLRPPSPWV